MNAVQLHGFKLVTHTRIHTYDKYTHTIVLGAGPSMYIIHKKKRAFHIYICRYIYIYIACMYKRKP